MSAPPTPLLKSGRVLSTSSRIASTGSVAGGPVGPPSVGAPKRVSLYERNVLRSRGEVSLAAFAYLFSEMIQNVQRQSKGVSDLEDRLNRLGYHVGQRVLELILLREGKSAKRETRIIGILQFINTTLWKALFGRNADALEKSTEDPTQYMIVDYDPVVTQFVSVPKESSQLNCAAYAAGIIEAVLDASLFTAEVTAHSMGTPEHPYKTVFLVQFDQEVIDMDAAL